MSLLATATSDSDTTSSADSDSTSADSSYDSSSDSSSSSAASSTDSSADSASDTDSSADSSSATTTIANLTEATDTVNADTTPTSVTDVNGSQLAIVIKGTGTPGTPKNTVGNDDSTATMEISINFAAHAGDVYVIKVPTSNVYKIATEQDGDLPTSIVTKTVEKGTDYYTFTYTFLVTRTTSTTITLTDITGYTKQDTPMSDPVGTYSKVITWTTTRDGVTTTNPELVLWQTISPTITASTVTRVTPSTSSGVTKVMPNVEYTYSFSVNENDGLDTGFFASQINSAVNQGATITIPVPAGFTLDAERSTELSTASSWAGTEYPGTISQPGGAGHDIIIAVPKGYGNQNFMTVPYKIVGYYAIDQPTSDTTLSAADNPLASNNGQITITQTVATTYHRDQDTYSYCCRVD